MPIYPLKKIRYLNTISEIKNLNNIIIFRKGQMETAYKKLIPTSFEKHNVLVEVTNDVFDFFKSEVDFLICDSNEVKMALINDMKNYQNLILDKSLTAVKRMHLL